jgi:hypothetical protein
MKNAALRSAENFVKLDQSGNITLMKRLDYESLQQEVSYYKLK